MGVNRVARGLFDPIIEFYRPLPPLAYLPLVIIWLGIGEVTDVVIMGIIVIGIIAYLFDMLMRYGEKKLVPWKGR